MSEPWPELLLLAYADKQNCSENNSYVHADKLEETPALAKRNCSEIDSFTVGFVLTRYLYILLYYVIHPVMQHTIKMADERGGMHKASQALSAYHAWNTGHSILGIIGCSRIGIIDRT